MDDVYDDLNLRQEFISAGKQNRSGLKITPTSITVHNTSNGDSGANAAAHSNFVRNTGYYLLNGKKNWVSWHFTVDDVQALQHLPIDERAIHAGPANAVSLAVEICMHQGIDQAAADLRAARLIAKLLNDLGLSNDSLRTHQSWTGKSCPQQLLPPKWQAFVQMVATARATIPEGPAAQDIFEPPFEVQSGDFIESTKKELDGDIDHDAMNKALKTGED